MQVSVRYQEQPVSALVTVTLGAATVGQHRTAANGMTSFIVSAEAGQTVTASAVDGAGRTGTAAVTV